MRLSLIPCVLLCLSACEGTPEYRLGFPAYNAGDLGAVAITERAVERVEVANTGQKPVRLEGVAVENGRAGVLTVDPDATGCVPGLVLSVGESCVVSIAFEPANDIVYADRLHVDYRADAAPEPFRASLAVTAQGILDCSLRDDFARSYEEGAAQADAQIALDVVEATAAGEALIAEDGYGDGYTSSFNTAYDRAYDSAYDDGSADGYNDGYVDGASAAACREGDLDGYADGADIGLVDGEADGFVDGEVAGYEEGYAIGFYDGETDSCGYAEKVDPDPSLPGKCVDQGYAATYSRRHYDEAYTAAVEANVAYQEGLSRGQDEGTSAGLAAGDAEGYADGYRDGAELGLIDGDADEYDACYALAFDEGYEDGYLEAYDAFFYEASEIAYSLGFEDGYASGFLVCG